MKLCFNRKVIKIILIFTGILLSAIVSVLYYYSFKYQKLVNQHYKKWVIQASDSLYQANIEEIYFNPITRKVVLKDIHFFPNDTQLSLLKSHQQAPDVVVDVNVPELAITGVEWESLLLHQQINVGDLSIYQPKIKVLVQKDNLDQNKKNQVNQLDAGKTQQSKNNVIPGINFLNQKINLLSAEKIEIIDPDIWFELTPRKKEDPYFISKGGYIAVRNWQYRPGMPKDTTLLFYAKGGEALIERMVYYKPGSQYIFGLDSLMFDPESYASDLRNFRMFPIQGKLALKQSSLQQTWVNLSIPRIYLKHLNWRGFLYDNKLLADTILLENLDVKLEMDKNKLPNLSNKKSVYPTNLINDLAIPFAIANVAIKDAKLEYLEHQDQVRTAASVWFGNINMNATNITNLGFEQPLEFNTNAKFMGISPCTLNLKFDPIDTNGKFDIEIHAQDIMDEQINPLAMNFAGIGVPTVHIEKLELKGNGDISKMNLKGVIEYSDLRVAIKKRDTTTNRYKNLGLINAIARELAYYSDNPMKGEPLREVSTTTKAIPYRSILNLLWKGVFDAAKATALRDPEFIDKFKEKRKERLNRKKERQLKKKKKMWQKSN